MKNVTKKSLENLKPIKSGEIRNPYGRKGANGLGGFSLKAGAKAFLAMLTDAQRVTFFNGLYTKCLDGDVQAIKLMAELNDEMTATIQVEGNLGCVILPPKAVKLPNEEDTK